jgi:hypothetical protein
MRLIVKCLGIVLVEDMGGNIGGVVGKDHFGERCTGPGYGGLGVKYERYCKIRKRVKVIAHLWANSCNGTDE